MNDESQLALTRFDFTTGANRGSQLMLYPRCLVHRSASQLETVPLSRVTAIKVSFKRDPRRLGWGIACVLAALLLLAISSPLGTFAHGAAQELTASGQGVARALYSLLRFMEVLAALLPAIALAGAMLLGGLGGIIASFRFRSGDPNMGFAEIAELNSPAVV